jgi:cytochrome c553
MAFPRKLLLCAGLAALLAPAVARAEDPGRAAELYELCAQCHGDDGGGNPAFMAPAIAGLPQWYVAGQLRNFKGGLRGLHPDDKGGLRMYPMSLAVEEADVDALAAFVAAMPPTRPAPTPEASGGDPAKGAASYVLGATCHGADGSGNQALNGPPLRGQHDWYLLKSLQSYKSGVRGNDPRNANASIMRGMAASLADEQAIKDVIAHIQTLGSQAAASGEQGN